MIKQVRFAVFLALFATLSVAVISLYKPLWQPFEKRVYDFKYKINIANVKQEKIVIIDIDESSLSKLGRYQNWPRAYFAEIINYLKDVRVIGVDIFFAEPDTLPTLAREYYTKPDFDSLLAAAIKTNGRVVLVSSIQQKPTFHDFNRTGIGEIFPDDDGVVRTGYYAFSGEKTFGAQVAEIVNGKIFKDKFLIYFLNQNAFRVISFVDVYLKRIPQEYFKDQIVLIGGSAPGLFDYHSVPFARHFPGIAIQANIINNFINNLSIAEISFSYVVLLIFVLTFIISVLTIKTSSRFYLIFYVVVYFLVGLTSVLLFHRRVEFGIIRPFYAFIIAIVTTLVYRYQFEEREKRKIKSIFSRYYSKELVEKVIAKPPKLGGEKVACTILFADIRNFTSYVEKTSPEQVGQNLNRFLTEMVNIIFEHRGRVDKFIGDCVMAIFGYPVELKNHALNACLAAREMVKKAADLGFKIGIGINSGEVISGNFGSPMRMEYTVIGDAVNLAARLENLTKEFGVNIIISEFTHRSLSQSLIEKLSLKELGKVKIRGKEEERIIYALE